MRVKATRKGYYNGLRAIDEVFELEDRENAEGETVKAEDQKSAKWMVEVDANGNEKAAAVPKKKPAKKKPAPKKVVEEVVEEEDEEEVVEEEVVEVEDDDEDEDEEEVVEVEDDDEDEDEDEAPVQEENTGRRRRRRG